MIFFLYSKLVDFSLAFLGNFAWWKIAPIIWAIFHFLFLGDFSQSLHFRVFFRFFGVILQNEKSPIIFGRFFICCFGRLYIRRFFAAPFFSKFLSKVVLGLVDNIWNRILLIGASPYGRIHLSPDPESFFRLHTRVVFGFAYKRFLFFDLLGALLLY